MAIHIRTFEKTIAAACENNKPLIIESQTAQQAFITALKDPLSKDKRIDHVYMGTVQNSKRPLYHRASLTIRCPRRYTYFSPDIQFNEQNELVITGSRFKKNYYINDLDSIFAVVEALHKLYIKEDQEETKKEKINALKATSMFGKLKEIAEEDGFEYAITRKKLYAVLLIKLTNRDALNIHVPYKNFQEVMQQVRPLIKTIRELTQQGITFKIQGFGYISWNTIEPE